MSAALPRRHRARDPPARCEDRAVQRRRIAKIREKYPWYTPYTIEKSWYTNALKGDARDVPTFTEWIYVAARDDFPAETAYQIAKVLGDHHDEMVAAFKAANSSTAENTAKYPGFKLHPGTERYLKEKGALK